MHSLRSVYIFKNMPPVASKSVLRHMGAKLLLGLPLQLLYTLCGYTGLIYFFYFGFILSDNASVCLWRYSLSLIHTEVTPISINGSQANILEHRDVLICFFLMRKTHTKISCYRMAPKRQESNSTIL